MNSLPVCLLVGNNFSLKTPISFMKNGWKNINNNKTLYNFDQHLQLIKSMTPKNYFAVSMLLFISYRLSRY